MKYVSISKIKQDLSNLVFPLSDSDMENLRMMLTTSSEWQHVDDLSKAYFLDYVQSEKKLLFATWTEENKVLLQALETKCIQSTFNDRLALSSHQLFEDYQAFIQPFLLPVLLDNCTDLDFKKTQQLMSFSVLLSKSDQDKLQSKTALFFGQIQEQLQESVKRVKNDQELFETLKQTITVDYWQTINLFNERFYRVKTSCLEFLLSLAYHKHSSRRLMLFIVSELKQLQLTKEHLKELKQVELDLKSGKHVFESTKVPWKRLVLLSLAAFVLVFIGVGVWFIPNNPENDTLQEKTSFMSFNPKERKELDSLIESAKKEQLKMEELEGEDQFLPEAPAQLVIRKTWENPIFNKLYQAWSLNDSVASSMSFVPGKKDTRAFPGTKHLRSKKALKKVDFHNSTNLNVLLVVFKNKAKEPVYTAYVGAKTLFEFSING
jgi:hypothetical protein